MPKRTNFVHVNKVWANPAKRDPFAALGDKIEPQPDGCWYWTGGVSEHGYGMTSYVPGTLNNRAHRVVYTILVGPIPEDHHLHHECRVRHCVNPAHLTPLTPSEHMRLHHGKAA